MDCRDGRRIACGVGTTGRDHHFLRAEGGDPDASLPRGGGAGLQPFGHRSKADGDRNLCSGVPQPVLDATLHGWNRSALAGGVAGSDMSWAGRFSAAWGHGAAKRGIAYHRRVLAADLPVAPSSICRGEFRGASSIWRRAAHGSTGQDRGRAFRGHDDGASGRAEGAMGRTTDRSTRCPTASGRHAACTQQCPISF